MTTTSTLTREDERGAAMNRFFSGHRRLEQNGRGRYGETLSGSAIVAEFLKFVGVDVVFGIPGGASLPLNDALTHGHAEGAFRYVLTGHEQGAAFEAEGYAEASGRVGFCTATSGPGATNLITALADAFRDSRPVVALTGNTATTDEPEAFQALDIVGITDQKATKASYRPRRPEEVQDVLVRAYHTAVTGRPGAVLVDLPKDVQSKAATMRPWEEIISTFDWSTPRASPAQLEDAVSRLAAAKRPLLYVGHGAVLAGARDAVEELSHRWGIPVAPTVHALGVLPSDDPLNLGMIGMYGTVVANLAAHRADVILAVGARFDDRVVTARPHLWATDATIIHVDADAAQLNRVRSVDVAIHGDAGVVLRQIRTALEGRLDDRAARQDRAEWLDELAAVRRAMPLSSYDRPESDQLSHEYVYAVIALVLRARAVADVVATFDVGTHQMKGAQWFPVDHPRSFITSGGMGSMGCALPLAVGAAMARPDATVIACAGDGGFVMSSHELDTIGGYGVPVKIVLFDDAHLGMVTNWHGLFFEGRKLTSDRRRDRERVPVDVVRLKQQLHDALDRAETSDDLARVVGEASRRLAGDEWPAFALTAASFGIAAERVHTKDQLRGAVERMLAADGPYLLHVELAEPSPVYPLVPPGATPRDLLWRETFPGSGQAVKVSELYDFERGRLRTNPTG